MILVTFEPILCKLTLFPVPELVIVPLLFTINTETQGLLLLFLIVKSPVPIILLTLNPPPKESIKVVPPEFTVIGFVIKSSSLIELFCIILVTFEPTPPSISIIDELVPELIIEPLLFINAEIVISPPFI